MIRKIVRTKKWKKLRRRVWEKRLEQQLSLLSHQYRPSIESTLKLAWGPFYGGSVMLNRSCTKAAITIQIPYDRYITANEGDVMSRYRIPKQALPYFILFHEYSHLLDALAHIRHSDENSLTAYKAAMIGAAHASSDYRNLPFEMQADRFAYQQYMRLRAEVG
jgi:hypothetical protein